MLTTIASPADDDTVVRFTSCEALLHQCPQRLLFPRIPDLDTATTSMSLLALTGDAWSRRRCSFSFLCEPPPLGLPLLELQLDMTHSNTQSRDRPRRRGPRDTWPPLTLLRRSFTRAPRATTVSDGFHPLTSMCYDWTWLIGENETGMGFWSSVVLDCRDGVVILFFSCAFCLQVEMVLWFWSGGSTNECDRMVMIIGRIGVSVECGGKVVIIGEIGLRQLNGEWAFSVCWWWLRKIEPGLLFFVLLVARREGWILG